jgi:hypothetical protein
MIYDHLMDNETKTAIISLKSAIILQEELLKKMEKNSVESSPLWMTLTVNPCYGSRDNLKIWPGWRLADIQLL